MPYRYLEDIAIADAAFEAWADSPEALLAASGEAVLGVMVGDPAAVQRRVRREVRLEEEEPELLLWRLLQEQVYYKDAERLLLHVDPLRLERAGGDGRERWALAAELRGEQIDPARHDLLADVKAVTLHRLAVWRDPGQRGRSSPMQPLSAEPAHRRASAGEGGAWRARVVLDV